MQTRTLGRTGRTVSVIGLGTWQLGADWGEVTEADAAPVEQAAATPSREKLPARSLVIPPQPHAVHLSELVEKRRSMAA